MLSFVLLLQLACLERVTGEPVPLDVRFTAQPSHGVASGDDTGGPQHTDQVHREMVHEEAPPPQPFTGVEGERVTVSGEIISESEGSVDLDIATVDPGAPGGLKNEGKLVLDGPGPFEVQVPVGSGELLFAAFQDLEADGPSEADPYAELVVEVSDAPVSALSFTLVAGARTASMGGPGHTVVPSPTLFAGREGETVTIKGTISSPISASIDLDVALVDEAADGGLNRQGKLMVDEPGPYTLEAPVGIGMLQLAAFQDLKSDGPTEDDPYAELRVEVGSTALDEVNLTLVVGGRGPVASSGPNHVEAPPGYGSGQAPPPSGSSSQDPFASFEGERVKVSGLLVWDGDGVIDMDLFTPDTDASGGRKLLGKLKRKPGAFTIEAPVSLGQLEIDAFADRTGDGPSGDDPRGSAKSIDLSAGSVTGVQVVLASLEEDAPPPLPEGGGTDIEEEFARTAAGADNTQQTGDGL